MLMKISHKATLYVNTLGYPYQRYACAKTAGKFKISNQKYNGTPEVARFCQGPSSHATPPPPPSDPSQQNKLMGSFKTLVTGSLDTGQHVRIESWKVTAIRTSGVFLFDLVCKNATRRLFLRFFPTPKHVHLAACSRTLNESNYRSKLRTDLMHRINNICYHPSWLQQI